MDMIHGYDVTSKRVARRGKAREFTAANFTAFFSFLATSLDASTSWDFNCLQIGQVSL